MILQGQRAHSSTRLLVFYTSLSPEQWFSECAPWSSVISTTWNLLEMQDLKSDPSFLNHKLNQGPDNLYLTSPPGNAEVHFNLKTISLERRGVQESEHEKPLL